MSRGMGLAQDEARLAERMAEAFEHFGGFVYQEGVDDPRAVSRIIHAAGVAPLLMIVPLGGPRRIYALVVDERHCRGRCRGSPPGCVEACRAEVSKKVAEALRRYARRLQR